MCSCMHVCILHIYIYRCSMPFVLTMAMRRMMTMMMMMLNAAAVA